MALEIPRLTVQGNAQLSDHITGELADLVESMIGRGHNRRQIWQELLDQHDYLVTYDSIHYYYRRTRRPTADHADHRSGATRPR
ncbi:hypothetical protein [Streptomyces sp. NPDC001530]|uniref:hypothetical protein n=1 Tax=Streptomyces sp. NPDC001530 TaxID=3364582 RepID=UPI00369C61B9